MHDSIIRIASLAAPLALSAVALAHHNHLTVRTETGTPGEALQIVAGYYEDEASLFIDPATGLLMDGGEPWEFHLTQLFADGPLVGQHTGSGLSLTSDFYAAEGLIDGADIYYQIVSVEPVEGAEAVLTWATTDERSGEIIPEATSGGESQLEQSLHVGFGGHPHGQLVALTTEGEYLVTLVAWDANGVYLPSEPVTLTVHSEYEPADLDGSGHVDAADLAMLLGAWGSPEADISGDGTTDAADLAILLGAWS